MTAHVLSSMNTKLVSQKTLVKILLGMALMTVCSNIQIPLKPVPITLQTIGVFFIALMYTPRNAFVTLAGWIAIGAAGAPVFSDFMGGLPKITGPTAGYIFSWPFAAFIVATLQQKYLKDKWYLMMMNILIGTVFIYVVGVSWLAYVLGSFDKAMALGLYPFILPGVIKAGILSVTLYGVKSSLAAQKK